MPKDDLLNLIRRPDSTDDAFDAWALDTVGAVADAIVASGLPLTTKAVLQSMENQCSGLDIHNLPAVTREHIAAIQAADERHFTKRVACLMPALMLTA